VNGVTGPLRRCLGCDAVEPIGAHEPIWPRPLGWRCVSCGRVVGQSDGIGIGREFTLNPRVNSLFTAILRREIRMTLAGMNWPAGGSRVVVRRAI
jgi:hypothetical protein